MLRHKNIDRIACLVLAFTLILTCGFMGAAAAGWVVPNTQLGYETRLFDQSRVHTIDIRMDDWESFLTTCTSETYANCTLVIDGEHYSNVAIRGKGNTSLSSVAQYGNDRYSFKVEFDHYQSSKSYYGLDKLCLNNLIQDKTYLKDYIAYTLMNRMGVAAPLCSFVQIRVNGEDWGFYLAVEGVEDGFLKRNYGNSTGSLYKPDSLSFGGGRGNGKEFDMSAFAEKFMDLFSGSDTDASTATENGDDAAGGNSPENGVAPELSGNVIGDNNMPTSNGDGSVPAMPDGNGDGNMPTMSDGNGNGNVPTMPDGNGDGNMFTMPTGNGDGNMPTMSDGNGDGSMPVMPTDNSDGSMPAMPDGTDFPFEMPDGMSLPDSFDFGDFDKGGNFGGSRGSDDVKLQYIDDDPDSYANIFDNAKTDIDDQDKARLIAALKNLSEGTDIDNTVDVEQVIRYFVVHNFLCNDDSYTGQMVHNYYLYEDDGQLSMIPWDYNLAFGGFSMGGMGGATDTVNTPIDSLVSSGDISDRPMAAWIFSDERYTELYHEIYSEWIETTFESGWFETEISRVVEMIDPYVQNDTNGFFTYEDFTTATESLKTFCDLRAKSIRGQLEGRIPSTTEAQRQNATALVDASEISLSDMGEFGMGGGGHGGKSERTSKGADRRTSKSAKQSGDQDTAQNTAEDPIKADTNEAAPADSNEVPASSASENADFSSVPSVSASAVQDRPQTSNGLSEASPSDEIPDASFSEGMDGAATTSDDTGSAPATSAERPAMPENMDGEFSRENAGHNPFEGDDFHTMNATSNL